LEVSDGNLHFIQREAAMRIGIGRVRLPRHLAPRVRAQERAAAPGQVHIAVSVTLPGIGLLIGYDGVVAIPEAVA
jgi:hypothetical protein